MHKTTDPDTSEDRIAELTALLRRTERELQELVGGQSDAQRDTPRAGEDALRALNASQRSILDATPGHIALLDADGIVRCANRAWRDFAVANGYAGDDGGVGRDYLRITEAAGEDGARTAAGIRAVLRGDQLAFTIEYPCHSRTTERWFQLIVTPLGDGGAGAVVLHVDVSERRLAERALRTRESMLVTAQRIGRMGTWQLDLAREILTWSPETYALFGVDAATFTPTIASFYSMVLPEDLPRLIAAMAAGAAAPDSVLEVDYRVLRPDGAVRSMFERGHVEKDAEGVPVRRAGMVMDVTERRSVERALELSEQRFRRVYQSAAVGIVLLTPTSAIVSANPAYCAMLGYAEEELLGRENLSLLNPEDRPLAAAILDDLVRGVRGSTVAELRSLRRDGASVWVRWSWAAQTSASGELDGLVAVAEDITAQKRSVERLRANEALLRVASRVGRLGGWTLALPDMAVTWSDEVRAIHEVSAGTPSLHEAIEFYPPEYRGIVTSVVEACITSGQPFDLELEILTAKGRRVWVRAIGEANRDDSGVITSLQGAFQDISERKDTERSLLKSEVRFRELCDGIPLIVWTAPASGTLDYANRAFSEYTGDTVDTPPEEVWLRAVHPDDAERCLAEWRRAVRAGTPFVAEFRLLHGRTGSHRWHLGRASPLRDESGAIGKWYGTCIEVHATKEAQEEASLFAERLGATLESITDVFFTVDPELRLTYANAEAERVLRLDGKHLLGRPFAESLSPGLDASLGEAVRSALPSPVPVEFEVAHDATGAWFSGRAFPSRGGLAVHLRDVTERRHSREALRSSEERFRLLAQATNDAVWEWDLATDSLRWSGGFDRMFGFYGLESDSTFASWERHLHPEDRDRVLASVVEAIRGTDAVWSHEYRFGTTDGGYAYVLDRGYIVRDASGAALRMVGGMTDLTERRRTEERLAEQAELIEKAQDAIMVRDLQGRVLYLNERAERLYGWTREESIGKDVRFLHGAADVAGFEAASEATLRKGEWRGELRQVAKDGQSVLVEGRWTLMRDALGAPRSVLVINTDISERKRLEEQLLRTQRLESIGTLAGGMAHDLNNLLTPILFSIALLGADEEDEIRREDLSVIEACAKRAAAMVGHLLAFARGIDGDRATLYLGSVLAEVERVLRDTFPKNITFRVNDAGEAWAVSADRTQLNQVLVNLCVNARDAMAGGGILSVSVDNVVLDEVYAGMNPLAHAGSFVVLRVEDTGEGMSPVVRDRIFEPFFTTKAVGQGTGLGLSTTHAIVKSHGGFINVYSEPGRGTTFRVYLPALVEPDVAEQVAITQTRLPRGQGELVLVVDDEASIRAMVQRTLEKFGYRVIVAANGAEAVALYAQHGAEVAVVLTDMAMPVMDGPATIVALRSMNPSVRIVGSSGLDANGKVALAVGAGVRHFVAKPYTAELMLTTLRSALTSREQA